MSLMNADELVARLRSSVPQIKPQDLLKDGLIERAAIFDIRDPQDAADGSLPNARLLPQRFIEFEIGKLGLAEDHPIIVSCYGGRTSLVAAQGLMALGYRNVHSLEGGFGAWKDAGLPVSKPAMLAAAERKRYSRHLSLPQVGETGQLALKRARVALVGAGGLGSPVALYLAAAGIGHIRLIDGDTVEDSNLQRQVIHGTTTLGQPKVESARQRMLDLNPYIEVEAIAQRLAPGNATQLLAGADIVVDGSDNFDTRYLVNDAAIVNRQTVVSASIFQFSAQLSVFAPHLGHPCYACLYPERTPNDLAPSCNSAGVLGALAGVVGLMQAMEVLKLVLGIGRPLLGSMLLYDGLNASTRQLRLERQASCPACGGQHHDRTAE